MFGDIACLHHGDSNKNVYLWTCSLINNLNVNGGGYLFGRYLIYFSDIVNKKYVETDALPYSRYIYSYLKLKFLFKSYPFHSKIMIANIFKLKNTTSFKFHDSTR